MITQTETSLTTDQYNAILAEKNDFDWRLTAYRWNLNFDTVISSDLTNNFSEWDAINFDSTIWRVNAARAEKLVAGVWTTVAGFADIGSHVGNYSLAVNGSILYVYAATTTGISVNTWNGSVWSGWSSIATISNLSFIAATDHNTVHYVVYDSTTYLWNFGVAKYSGSWSTTASDIYWQYIIYGFDAVRVGTKDVLTFSAAAPGNLSAQYIDGQAVKTTTPSSGVFSLIYQYSSWSDHFTVDLIDEESTWKYRKYIYTSLIEGVIHAVCMVSTGTQNYPYRAYRHYTSKDGKHWSRGEFLSIDAYRYGAILLKLGDYAYITERSQSHRSLATLQVGTPASSTILDITNEVKDLRLSRRDMAQISFTLSNATDWLDTSILNGDNSVVFKLEAGWYSAEDEEILYQQVGIFELDSLGHEEGLAKDDVKVTARDYLSRMSSRTQSEDFLQWEPQFGGGDEYVDNTETGYGALGNTGVYSGSWGTENSSLILKSSNTEGVALSALMSELWNGSQQHSFTLANTSNAEYAGIIFRGQDKDNFYAFYYNQDTDKIYIIERVAGVDSYLWTDSGTRSWSGSPSTRRWLRVDFRYARIIAYTSNDGITWTQRASILTNGQAATTYDYNGYPIITDQKIFRGLVGVFGRGYSDQDTFTYTAPTYGAPTLPPLVYPVRNLDGSLAPYTTDLVPTKMFVAAATSAQAAVATGITVGGTFTWTEISTGLTGNGIWASSDPFNYERIYLLTTTGLYTCTPYSFSGWTLVANNLTIFGNATYVGTKILMSINRRGWIYLISGTGMRAWSSDYGATWTNNGGSAGTGISPWYHDVVVSPFNDGDSSVGWMYACVNTGTSINAIYKSTDWGVNWTSLGTVNMIGWRNGRLNIPYKKSDGTDNINDSTQLLYAACGFGHSGNAGGIFKSVTAGTSWTTHYSASASGIYVPAGSYGGSSIQTFTYDGGVIFCGNLLTGAGGGTVGLFVQDDGTLISNTGHINAGTSYLESVCVNGFSYSRLAALFWNQVGTSAGLKYTVDGSTIHDVNLPSFFTGSPKLIGYAEWSLIDQWTPPA